jgi:acyl-CoA dehydrogenase
MDFAESAKVTDLKSRLIDFMDEHVYPAEEVYHRQLIESGEPHYQPPIMEELKRLARERGLWNLFLPDSEFGAGLTNVEYAPLAEITGRSSIAPETVNCAAPDTGNMEILSQFGTKEQQERWLRPLLDGEIQSCFGMTEPGIASSDANNIQSRIERDGDNFVINGRKWWTTGILSPRCKFVIFMGKSDPSAPPHLQQSMVIVPLDSAGITFVRALPVFGYDHGRGGHGETIFEDVRVPVSEGLLGEEGGGFAIAQARLGPGRIHHCMRAIGMAERALDLMVRRVVSRSTFGKRLSEQGVIQEWIADSRADIEQARLLVLKTAWLMDTVGNKGARIEISAIKAVVPSMVERIIDRSIQAHGGAGVSEDFPLAAMYASVRAMRLADGPDEVHKVNIARREIRRIEAEMQ